ncbi:MAG: hypothetical protein M1834_007124 [Cirrosporium novae-zelandiae]|nr:MAG: hypothetical protein M1834_007124 [Cirrosporium novae-zelandiae]
MPQKLLSCLKAPFQNGKRLLLSTPSISEPRSLNILSRPPTSLFSTARLLQASNHRQRRRYHDPYALAQSRNRKAANLARQKTLKEERAVLMGDPVHGITTPFVQSFDTGVLPPKDTSAGAPKYVDDAPVVGDQQPEDPNYFLTPTELASSISYSGHLTTPVSSEDPHHAQLQARKHAEDHKNALTALERITALANGSSQDRTRVNIQHCISTFGRHATDAFLRPKPASRIPQSPDTLPPAPRAGPDTGSPEVQAAILTAKIRLVANHMDANGRNDKVNKRNLRLLVHRRQKLLAYLRRKERGGPRWQHLVETLGLTEGTWKGEITM